MNLDFLKVKKIPIKKSDISNQINEKVRVEKKMILTDNNNTKIIDFIQELESEILLNQGYFIKKERNLSIGNAVKIDRKIVLQQLTPEEIQTIKINKKYISTIYTEFEDDNNENNNVTDPGTPKKRKPRKIVKYDFENG